MKEDWQRKNIDMIERMQTMEMRLEMLERGKINKNNFIVSGMQMQWEKEEDI